MMKKCLQVWKNAFLMLLFIPIMQRLSSFHRSFHIPAHIYLNIWSICYKKYHSHSCLCQWVFSMSSRNKKRKMGCLWSKVLGISGGSTHSKLLRLLHAIAENFGLQRHIPRSKSHPPTRFDVFIPYEFLFSQNLSTRMLI